MKKVAVIIRRPPHGKHLASEGLRVATALTLYDLEIFVIAIDDGVYTFLKNADMSTYREHVDYLLESEIKIMLDEDDVKKRSITGSDVIGNIIIAPHSEIIDTISQCNVTLVF